MSTEDPTTHNPQPTTPPATAGTPPKRRRRQAAGDEPDGFAEWYTAFPRHEARVKAAAAYRSALRKRGITAAFLLDGAHRYARLVEADSREHSKILHPATWLNGERWNDETPARTGPHLHAITAPAPLPTDAEAAFVALRERADAKAAADLLGIAWVEPAQRPSDPTPYPQWSRARRLDFLDEHRDAICAALNARRTG